MSEPCYVTANPERYRIYRLCDCLTCGGTGKAGTVAGFTPARCLDCRGEGRTRDLVATCASAEAVGVALVTLGREGEWEGCPVGLIDTEGEEGERWLVRPWLPSARNVSQAGRVLAAQRKGKT